MQQFFKSELGRSMLEMLGVLAIIGVLSIAAMAGYSYAVTKWKANETIVDLHTRALEYTRQLAMRKKIAPDFSFNNFDLGDENALGNPISGFLLFDDPSFFEIEVHGVSAEVCEQIIRDKSLPILDVAVNGGDYGALAEECGTETPGNLVTMTFLFSQTLEAIGNPKQTEPEVTIPNPGDCDVNLWANIAGVCCAQNERGRGGHCCPRTSSGWGKNVGRCCNAAEIYSGGHCCPTGQFWDPNSERCVSESDQCASNDDCLLSEFCALIPVECGEVKPAKGICKSAGISLTKKVQGITYKTSTEGLNFWAAENFCARLGGSLASLKDFECGYDFIGEKNACGYCNTDTNTTPKGTRSDAMKLFMNSGFGDGWFRLSDYYSGCRAYYVSFIGIVYAHSDRAYTSAKALCRIDE